VATHPIRNQGVATRLLCEQIALIVAKIVIKINS
jgi:hypothetical protein